MQQKAPRVGVLRFTPQNPLVQSQHRTGMSTCRIDCGYSSSTNLATMPPHLLHFPRSTIPICRLRSDNRLLRRCYWFRDRMQTIFLIFTLWDEFQSAYFMHSFIGCFVTWIMGDFFGSVFCWHSYALFYNRFSLHGFYVV